MTRQREDPAYRKAPPRGGDQPFDTDLGVGGVMGLRDGWAEASIGDLLSKDGVFSDGDWVESKDQDPGGGVRLIQLADVGDGVYVNKSQRFLTPEKAIELGCTYLVSGDLLIARMPDPLGRACLFPGDPKRSVTVVDVCIIRTANEIVTLQPSPRLQPVHNPTCAMVDDRVSMSIWA